MMHDYRKSRFYKEAFREGFEEGKADAIAKGKAEMLLDLAQRMEAKGLDMEEISFYLGVEAKTVREVLQTGRQRAKILELLESVANLSDEVRAMSGLDDYRKSRFYQDRIKEGKTEMLREKIRQMASTGVDAKQISDFLGVDIKIVRKALKTGCTTRPRASPNQAEKAQP